MSSDGAAAGEQAFWFLGNLAVLRLGGPETDGRLCMVEVLAPPGGAAPPHLHDDDEVFHVLEGRVTVAVGKRRIDAGPGDVVHVPGGTPHGYQVAEDAPARWMVTNVPAGFDAFVAEIAEPARDLTLPPPPDPAQMDAAMGALLAAAERHGVTLLPPDAS